MKRILALFMAVVLVIGLLPSAAFWGGGGRPRPPPYGERVRLRLIFTAKQKARTHTGAGQKS